MALVSRLIDVIEQEIIPLTRDGVTKGNKVFGAAILRKSDLSLVIASTNRESENPLWHGEIATINAYYELPASSRPNPKDCYFLATHEPCSLCLSGITWSGFDNFYFLFGYENTRDTFNIPHDLQILKEVFKVEQGNYARANDFWTGSDLNQLIAVCEEPARTELSDRVKKIATVYDDLSAIYQASKGQSGIPLN